MKLFGNQIFCKKIIKPSENLNLFFVFELNLKKCQEPETLKYWVGVQRGESYLMGRSCVFSLGWRPFS